MKQIYYFFITLLCIVSLEASGQNQYKINTVLSNYDNIWGVAVDAQNNVYVTDAERNRIYRLDAITGVRTIIAGTGTEGYSGDGGPATAAMLDYPTGITVDAAGNVYFADGSNDVVRKIDATTHVISTIAGNGNRGFAGDGGQATAAQLHFPSDVALDTAGNIYIVDHRNDRIRKVDITTGVISTKKIMGDVYDIALDANNNIYAVNDVDKYVRKIDATTGSITIFAGDGNALNDGGPAHLASLRNPKGLAIDAAGNVYIADVLDDRIRKVDARTGIITTIAGTGAGGYSGDGGVATSARINYPFRVAVDALGNVYFTDWDNDALRKLTPLLPPLEVKQGVAVVANKSKVDFGSQVLNATKKLEFVIKNKGKDTLLLTNLKVTGDFSTADASSLTVPGQDSIVIQVAMNTSSPGDKAGALSFLSNNLVHASFGLQLTGKVRNDQTISFGLGSDATKKVGEAAFALTGTASSGLAVSFSSSNTSVATISGNLVTIVGAGTATITATQAGNDNYAPAPAVARTLTVNKHAQVVSFDLGSDASKKVGAPVFTLTGTASSGLAVSFSSSNASVVIVSGNLAVIVGAGTATVTANQAGNEKYASAPAIARTLTVTKKTQTISFSLGDHAIKNMGDPPFELMATGSASGNPVTFTSSNTEVVTISGNMATIVGGGTATITASQAGDAAHEAAPDVAHTLTVNLVSALSEDPTQERVVMFPNPVSGSAFLTVLLGTRAKHEKVSLQMFDRQGKKVQELTPALQNGKVRVPVGGLVAGVYTLKIKIGKELITRRLIVY
ncbi:NHL domain-containing protein [Microscilla marina]|uniref:Uncharacterized protein n=1 Tax=Microscilla marina ATCC 23134 TaxID=313606 RepID=A1ZNH5_MICM2|nr:T9SS type A sorting domain-containing protein [Microscilla marina]EAY28086.1 conserved hypothetical protein [Microscilla marina ATCC 23134]